MTFQELMIRMQDFWAQKECVIWQPYDVEKGAGTMNPATFCVRWAGTLESGLRGTVTAPRRRALR